MACVHGEILVYPPHYLRIKMLGYIRLPSAVNIERTSPKDCQFILGEMGVIS